MKPLQISGSFMLLFLLLAVSTTAIAQSPGAVSDLAARINSERLQRGLVPYATSPQLNAAAQAHANDLASTGKYSHTGSDGSTVFERAARAGYGAYSWGRRLGENWAWYKDAATAMTQWMGSTPHRENILHKVYREMGIGIAPGKAGGYVYVVDFGAQPNVLPVVINDGAPQTAASNVTLRLYDEDVYDGSSAAIGPVKDIQISNDPNFAGASWQPFDGRIPWSLLPGTGNRTVYVKFRDAHGKTATSSDSIVVGSTAASMDKGAVTATRHPSPTATRTRKPTATVTRTPRPTATATPDVQPTDEPDATETPATPDDLAATETPSPTSSPEPTQVLPSAGSGEQNDSGSSAFGGTKSSVPLEPASSAETVASISLPDLATLAPTTAIQLVHRKDEVTAEPTAVSVRTAARSESLILGTLDPLALGVLALGSIMGGFAALKYAIARRAP